MTREEFIEKYCYVPAGEDGAFIDSSTQFRKDLDELLKQKAIAFEKFVRENEWYYISDWNVFRAKKNINGAPHLVTPESLYELYKNREDKTKQP